MSGDEKLLRRLNELRDSVDGSQRDGCQMEAGPQGGDVDVEPVGGGVMSCWWSVPRSLPCGKGEGVVLSVCLSFLSLVFVCQSL